MDSSDESIARSSDEWDAASDEKDEPVSNKLETDDCTDQEPDRMDQLESDMTEERDRIERDSDIEYQAGVSVDRDAELVPPANKHMEEADNVPRELTIADVIEARDTIRTYKRESKKTAQASFRQQKANAKWAVEEYRKEVSISVRRSAAVS